MFSSTLGLISSGSILHAGQLLVELLGSLLTLPAGGGQLVGLGRKLAVQRLQLRFQSALRHRLLLLQGRELRDPLALDRRDLRGGRHGLRLLQSGLAGGALLCQSRDLPGRPILKLGGSLRRGLTLLLRLGQRLPQLHHLSSFLDNASLCRRKLGPQPLHIPAKLPCLHVPAGLAQPGSDLIRHLLPPHGHGGSQLLQPFGQLLVALGSLLYCGESLGELLLRLRPLVVQPGGVLLHVPQARLQAADIGSRSC
mmetsp:Transcript_22878/g.51749  ORF Transcript_22878/g.51749 Transcript_22878/m.51749 type:complete len:253 (+) Transcript_22878:2923-3681(+)